MKAGPPDNHSNVNALLESFTCTGIRLGWYSSSSDESDGKSTSQNVAVLYYIIVNIYIYDNAQP